MTLSCSHFQEQLKAVEEGLKAAKEKARLTAARQSSPPPRPMAFAPMQMPGDQPLSRTPSRTPSRESTLNLAVPQRTLSTPSRKEEPAAAKTPASGPRGFVRNSFNVCDLSFLSSCLSRNCSLTLVFWQGHVRDVAASLLDTRFPISYQDKGKLQDAKETVMLRFPDMACLVSMVSWLFWLCLSCTVFNQHTSNTPCPYLFAGSLSVCQGVEGFRAQVPQRGIP